jgi:hypothetical protein
MPVVFQYAAKIVIGRSDGEVAAPGEYWTAINVHNPYHYTGAMFRKRVVVALPFEKPGPVSRTFFADLGPSEASEIDRADIFNHLAESDIRMEFVKGFVVIESPTELNVVAVYTTMGREEIVQTFHTERVPSRVLEIVRWEE